MYEIRKGKFFLNDSGFTVNPKSDTLDEA